jgi:hypothetical protein
MKAKKEIKQQTRGWIPETPDFNSVMRVVEQQGLMSQRIFFILSVSFSCLFVLSAFAPIAGYHLISTDMPGAWGSVWNFMLPTGWFSIIVGVCLLLLSIRRSLSKWFTPVMFAASISLIAVFFLQDVDYFIGLWIGVSGNFDLEGRIAVPFFLGIAGILASLLLTAIRSKPNAHSGSILIEADKPIAQYTLRSRENTKLIRVYRLVGGCLCG